MNKLENTSEMNTYCSLFVLAVLGTALPVSVSYAYIGPGAGLSAVGSLLALIVAVVVAVLGFIWFPIKRLLRKRKKADNTMDNKQPDPAGNEDKAN